MDAIVADCDLVAELGRKCIGLKGSRADARIGNVKMFVIVHVFEAQAHGLCGAYLGLKLFIKASVGVFGFVI